MAQIIIITLLIIIIVILLQRKFSINVINKDNAQSKLPSIMGDTKPIQRQALPIDAVEGRDESIQMTIDNFESETIEEIENVGQNKNLTDILVRNDDWEQEEEDWKYQSSNIESGFATGVTFQELSTAGQLLQQEVLEPDLEQQAVNIIQRIQGTELFNLLENSLGDASKRISTLLRDSTSNDDQTIFSKYNNSADGFDIGEFV